MSTTDARASVTSNRERVIRAVLEIERTRDDPTVGPTAYGMLTAARTSLLSALAFPLDASDERVSLEEFRRLCEGAR